MPENRRIAIITDDPGWHGRQLKNAFASRCFDSNYISLTGCRFNIISGEAGLVLPTYGSSLPDAVFVRGVPGGTLQQVILRLDVLHGLAALGRVVYNNGRAIERTVDKAMTSFLLMRAGIPTPKTWVCESLLQAKQIIQEASCAAKALVMKPLFGSQGEGIILLRSVADLPDMAEYGDVFYLQEFIQGTEPGWRDWRVFVIGGRAIAAMMRRSQGWVTNRARGAECLPMTLDPVMSGLAEDAVRALQIDYAGVDLMCDHEGRFLVTEVNSIPAWKGLQGVCPLDIAGCIADHFVSRIDAADAYAEARAKAIDLEVST